MGHLFEALADLHHRHHRQHSRNGHQDDEHHCDTHDLSLDRQPDHGAIHFKEWPSLKSFRRFHQTDTKQALRLIHINALLSQNVLLAAFASVGDWVMNIRTSILSGSLPTLLARANELIE